MKRQLLLRLLNNYFPSDAQEIESKQRIINFVQKHENCFERSLEIGHITGSCWLLNHQETHALLMHHTKLDKWLQLGGHADGDHDVLAVALKEAQEESGIQNIVPLRTEIFDIDVHEVPAHKNIPPHCHYDIRFLLKVASDEQVIHNNESKELRWVSKNRALLPTNERAVTRMFDKWVALS